MVTIWIIAEGATKCPDGGTRGRVNTVNTVLHSGVFGPSAQMPWRRWVSPILVQPVREHRATALSACCWENLKRRHGTGMNPGMERNVAAGLGRPPFIQTSFCFARFETARGGHRSGRRRSITSKRWRSAGALSPCCAPHFTFYVPRRWSMRAAVRSDNHINVHEILSYHSGDDVRFTLIHCRRTCWCST